MKSSPRLLRGIFLHRLELKEFLVIINPYKWYQAAKKEIAETNAINKQLEKIAANLDIGEQLNKYCSHKYKGEYHINQSDLNEIENIISTYSPHLCRELTKEKGGKIIFTVYDKECEQLVFQSPVRKNK